MLSYISETNQFLKLVDKNVKITLRLHSEDYLWSMQERIKEVNENSNFDKTPDFKNMLNKCSIFVTNYLGTTLLESLAINKPTICFINFNFFSFSDAALPYINMLKETKILHDSADSAAGHLNNIYTNLSSWWQDNKTQKARLDFINIYAKTEKNWKNKWTEELDSNYDRKK